MDRFEGDARNRKVHLSNFPSVLTSFIGRTREIAEVVKLLTSSKLVTMTGAAGCGKTRLALRVAAEASGNYADGVYFIELARLSDLQLVLQTVARALSVAEQPGRLPLDTLLAALQEKRCLLVLDNCEHLADACAQFIESLLAAPEISVLATSREALRVTGEKRYLVLPFALPPTSVPVERLGQFDAVRLFIEQARAILPHFELTHENAASVVNICQRLDGIPLVIELASGRTNVLTIDEIAARLDDRFALLTAAAHITYNHHRTLRAAIEWGYELLSDSEQTLLRRLSVFVGGCSLATAEAVCAQDSVEFQRVLELLSSLVDKSFMVSHTLQRRDARYSLPETVRQYAQEKLRSSGEAVVMRDRHLQCFVRLTEETAPKLIEQYQELWLNWLEDEYDNLRAALTWSTESAHIEEGLRIAVALFEFWQKRRYVQEGFGWFERLLKRPDEDLSLTARAHAFFAAGLLAMVLGNTSATIEYGRKACRGYLTRPPRFLRYNRASSAGSADWGA